MTSDTETADYCAMLRRMIRSLSRRIAEGDEADLAAAMKLSEELDFCIRVGVQQMNEQQGYSWAEIARAAGTTRQAAWQRWSRPQP